MTNKTNKTKYAASCTNQGEWGRGFQVEGWLARWGKGAHNHAKGVRQRTLDNVLAGKLNEFFTTPVSPSTIRTEYCRRAKTSYAAIREGNTLDPSNSLGL